MKYSLLSVSFQWLPDLFVRLAGNKTAIHTLLHQFSQVKLNTWHPLNNFILNCNYFPLFSFSYISQSDCVRKFRQFDHMWFLFFLGYESYYLMMVAIEHRLIADFIYCIVFIGHFALLRALQSIDFNLSIILECFFLVLLLVRTFVLRIVCEQSM